ncbi:amino acid ABC transporter permease [Xanthomonas sp. Kuri4-1]
MFLSQAQVLQGDYGRMFLDGLRMTLALAVCAWLLAMTLALVLVSVRLGGRPWVERAVAAYVAYHRNVPTLVQLMMWYFGIPALFSTGMQVWLAARDTEFVLAVIALALCQAAYFSEDIRTGLRALPPGQMEAARSLGLGEVGALRHVILPQALRHALPALLNNSILLFKNTSLAMAIGLAELTYATREIENQSFLTFACYLVATVLYLACCLVLMAGGRWLDRRYRVAGARP